MDVIFEIYAKKWTRITEFHRCVKFTVAQCYHHHVAQLGVSHPVVIYKLGRHCGNKIICRPFNHEWRCPGCTVLYGIFWQYICNVSSSGHLKSFLSTGTVHLSKRASLIGIGFRKNYLGKIWKTIFLLYCSHLFPFLTICIWIQYTSDKYARDIGVYNRSYHHFLCKRPPSLFLANTDFHSCHTYNKSIFPKAQKALCFKYKFIGCCAGHITQPSSAFNQLSDLQKKIHQPSEKGYNKRSRIPWQIDQN